MDAKQASGFAWAALSFNTLLSVLFALLCWFTWGVRPTSMRLQPLQSARCGGCGQAAVLPAQPLSRMAAAAAARGS